MKIALAQINPLIGDLEENAARIKRNLRMATDQGAELVIFPELAICGYPPRDLLLKPQFIRRCQSALQSLADACTDTAAIIGLPTPNGSAGPGRALHNTAALCYRGQVLHQHHKGLLPNYDVFDECRYFEPGTEVTLADWRNQRLGISVCEDLWNDEEIFSHRLYPNNPIQTMATAGATLLVNCSASPFVLRKHALRLRLMQHVARRHGVALAYCNQVGGNDDLIFDGRSCVVDARGELLAQAAGFEEDLLLVDLDAPALAPSPPPEADDHDALMAELYRALVLGLRDYCQKCGFGAVVLGLSGGIDSALTAAIAVAALGADRVRGVAMPSRYSSDHSVADAQELARRLGIGFDVVPIEPAHAALEGMLASPFAGQEPDVTEENLQARLRGVIMMAMSNKFGALLLTTGNKSELAVGYCTLYGDMCGGYALLSDVPKTLVYALSHWLNHPSPANDLFRRFGPTIPENTLEKPPSAELRPGQVDQDSLPPYAVLDAIIERYVEQEASAAEIIADLGCDAPTVYRMLRLIDRSEYKRKQAAPGAKVTTRAFGSGRRLPTAQRYDHQAAPSVDTAI